MAGLELFNILASGSDDIPFVLLSYSVDKTYPER